MKLVCGVGVNDLPKGSCSVMVDGKAIQHPFYKKWKSMIERSYSEKCHDRNPTYLECSVCEEWKTLSKFKSWFDQQNPDRYCWQLDKDVLLVGNKIYSPETCLLVPSWLNMFVTDGGANRSNHAVGVCWREQRNKYQAAVRDIHGNKRYLGVFTDELSAHLAWKAAKLQIVHDMKTDLDVIDIRVYPALVKRYS